MVSSSLSEILKFYRESILSTTIESILLNPYKSSQTDIYQSKIGGVPYLPKNKPYPLGKKQQQLFFLSQINFAELPNNHIFPKQGILQFFINDDLLYGKGVLGIPETKDFKIIYHREVESDPTKVWNEITFVREFKNLPLVFNEVFALNFEIQKEVMPPNHPKISEYINDLEIVRQVKGLRRWPDWLEINVGIGHKLGGYANFFHDFPHHAGSLDVLLFQLDSDSNMNCVWGDLGTAYFLLSIEKMLEKNYEMSIFYWDSY